MLFCVSPVCYDVRLSHLNEDYLLTYKAHALTTAALPQDVECVYMPHAGSGVVRIVQLRFLAGCGTRRLNQV